MARSQGTSRPGISASSTDTLTNKTIDGDTNTVQDLAVTVLKDGTDGQIITWGADGVATTVATGDAGEVLTSAGAGAPPTFQAAAGGGATVVSVTPGMPGYWSFAATANTAFNSNTKAHWCLVNFPATITVNKISFITRSDAIGTASTFDIVLYAEDGQSQLIAVTTASIAAGSTVYTTAVSAVEVAAGNYYIGMIANTDAFDGRFTRGLTPGFFDGQLAITSEPVWVGTSAATAGTMPATINPVSGITVAASVNDSIPMIRFDN